MKTMTTIACAALVAVLSTFVAPAPAQPYPNKPIRFLVGFVAGGTNDIVARALAQKLTENMGQSAVVENCGGGYFAGSVNLAPI